MKEKSAVVIKNLVKNYTGTQALNGISVDIPAGKITGLIGPNGSGKSTMLKAITGLVNPTRGDIMIFGQKPGLHLKEKIAFLPEINHFYKWMTVKRAINFTQSQFSNFDRNKAEEIMKFMNLKEEKRINELSKGMVGRVKLVLTMARNVPLIVMDEPLAGIDPNSRARILESLISEFNAEEQTIILSTHEVMEAERFFDYVIFLEDGSVRLQDNADDLRKKHNKSIQDLVREVFV